VIGGAALGAIGGATANLVIGATGGDVATASDQLAAPPNRSSNT
jgi:hypothetical protein